MVESPCARDLPPSGPAEAGSASSGSLDAAGRRRHHRGTGRWGELTSRFAASRWQRWRQRTRCMAENQIPSFRCTSSQCPTSRCSKQISSSRVQPAFRSLPKRDARRPTPSCVSIVVRSICIQQQSARRSRAVCATAPVMHGPTSSVVDTQTSANFSSHNAQTSKSNFCASRCLHSKQ